MDFSPADPTEPPASDLLAAMNAEITTLYGKALDAPDMPTASPAEITPPRGTTLVGRIDGAPVCVGAVKDLGDGTAEIKRMYVVPQARGRGAGRALLVALESAARDLGYTTVKLDTGPKQPGAEAMYRAAGYREIENFNGNPIATFFGVKELGQSP